MFTLTSVKEMSSMRNDDVIYKSLLMMVMINAFPLSRCISPRRTTHVPKPDYSLFLTSSTSLTK